MVLLKKDYLYSEIKYKSETNEREVQFENFLMMLLTNIDSDLVDIDCLCR